MLQTVLLRHLIEIAGDKGVYCTAMTGTAAQALPGGTTLHKFAGCGLARGDAAHLVKGMKFPQTSKWRGARVVFIDEVSMADADLFEKFDQVAKILRSSRIRVWGGIQLVMVGDFLQLPPVAKDGPVRMLFESPLFEEVTKVKLTRVFRQKEPELLNLLEAVRYGRLQPQHIQLLQSLDRPLPNSEDAAALQATKLYPVNALVDRENQARLHSSDCEGEVHTFPAATAGRKADVEYLIKNCPAAESLELRINAQVGACSVLQPPSPCRPDRWLCRSCRSYTW